MTGSVLSTGDGHQGWQDKLSIMMVLELSICLKTGAMTLKTVLDKGYGSQFAVSSQPQSAICGLRSAICVLRKFWRYGVCKIFCVNAKASCSKLIYNPY